MDRTTNNDDDNENKTETKSPDAKSETTDEKKPVETQGNEAEATEEKPKKAKKSKKEKAPKEEKEEKKEPKKAEKPAVIYHSVVVGLTADESVERARTMAENGLKIERLKREAKDTQKQLAAQVSEIELENHRLFDEVHSRTRRVSLACHAVADHAAGEMHLVEIATGVIVHSRTLELHERQLTLPVTDISPNVAATADAAPTAPVLQVVPETKEPVVVPVWWNVRFPAAAWIDRGKGLRERLEAQLNDASMASSVKLRSFENREEWIVAGPLTKTPALEELLRLAFRMKLAPELLPAAAPGDAPKTDVVTAPEVKPASEIAPAKDVETPVQTTTDGTTFPQSDGATTFGGRPRTDATGATPVKTEEPETFDHSPKPTPEKPKAKKGKGK